MNAIDTNIWVYRHDSRDPQKHAVAVKLISTIQPLALPWQIGCEFIAASRKLAHLGFDEAKAWAALARMQALASAVVMPTVQLWQDCQSMQTRHSLSFWDALLVTTCIDAGVTTLYTEDMGAPRQIDSLTLVNPFLPPPPP